MSDFSSSERTFYRYLLSLGAETEENHESDGDNIRDVFSIDVLGTTSPNWIQFAAKLALLLYDKHLVATRPRDRKDETWLR